MLLLCDNAVVSPSGSRDSPLHGQHDDITVVQLLQNVPMYLRLFITGNNLSVIILHVNLFLIILFVNSSFLSLVKIYL